MAKKLQIGDAVSTVSTIKIDDQEAGGGTTVEASTQLVEGANTANSLKIGDTDWNLPQGGGGLALVEFVFSTPIHVELLTQVAVDFLYGTTIADPQLASIPNNAQLISATFETEYDQFEASIASIAKAEVTGVIDSITILIGITESVSGNVTKVKYLIQQ